MARTIMPTISDPGNFVYDPDNPTIYTEACSHAVHQILYALSATGFELSDESSGMRITLDRDRELDEITLYSSMESIDEGG